MNQDQFELKPYEEAKRKRRGKGAKLALCYIGIRIEKDVLEFFDQFPNRQAVIREALKQYIEKDRKERANAESN